MDETNHQEAMEAAEEVATPAFGRRVVALLLDLAVIGVPLGLLQAAASRLLFDGQPPTADGPRLEAYVLATVSLPVWIYFVVQESGPRRATVGKRALGLQVAATAIDDDRVTRGQAILRTLVKLLPLELIHVTLLLPTPAFVTPPEEVVTRPGFVMSTMLVGSWLITAMLTKRGQAPHDLIARTRVVGARGI